MLPTEDAVHLGLPGLDNIGDSTTVLSTTGVELPLTGATMLRLYDVDGDGNLDLLGGGKVCFNSAEPTSTTNTYATGGNKTTSGKYAIHTFTSDGIFEVTDAALTTVEVLVVGGGGGGANNAGGGGGGECMHFEDLGVAMQSYTLTVVAGGAGGTGDVGGLSSFAEFQAGGGADGDANGDGGASGGSNWNLGGAYYQGFTSHSGGGGGGSGGAGIDG